jgi:hypothetical protein
MAGLMGLLMKSTAPACRPLGLGLGVAACGGDEDHRNLAPSARRPSADGTHRRSRRRSAELEVEQDQLRGAAARATSQRLLPPWVAVKHLVVGSEGAVERLHD